MSIFQQILAALGGITAVAILVGAACWRLVDSGLTAWLTKRVGRGLERDAERYKHELARDMETYKDELTRSQGVERVRAEVRKVVAEKLLEKRLTAYHELYVATVRIPSSILSFAMLPAGSRGPINNVVKQMQEFTKALETHQLYVGNEFGLQFREAVGALLEIIGPETWDTAPPLTHEDARVQHINRLVGGLNRQLEQYYKSLPDDLANAIANP